MTRVISLSDDAYAKLADLKESGESFSKVVLRIAEKERKHKLSDLAGIWKDEPRMDKIFAKILSERHKSMPREVKL